MKTYCEDKDKCEISLLNDLVMMTLGEAYNESMINKLMSNKNIEEEIKFKYEEINGLKMLIATQDTTKDEEILKDYLNKLKKYRDEIKNRYVD